MIGSVVVLVLVGLGVGLTLAFGGGGSAAGTDAHLVSPPPLGPQGPEGIPAESGPDLAPAASPLPDTAVDGIKCQGGEQTLFHNHARLTIFVDGRQEKVPTGVGIGDPQTEPTQRGPFVAQGACFSWLHTHASDGIIHIESPVRRTFTVGDFFDVWGQPLTRDRVGPAKGRVTALVNGRAWTGDPRSIPLHAHTQIQLDVGEPLVGAVRISNWEGL